MARLVILVALGLLFSCATSSSIPPMPGYRTDRGKGCGLECQTQYSTCMQSEVRPDFLLMSPRKDACQKMLRECYDTCLSKE